MYQLLLLAALIADSQVLVLVSITLVLDTGPSLELILLNPVLVI